nr:unnamed protein product [Digitaria exilis]
MLQFGRSSAQGDGRRKQQPRVDENGSSNGARTGRTSGFPGRRQGGQPDREAERRRRRRRQRSLAQSRSGRNRRPAGKPPGENAWIVYSSPVP